MKLLSFAAIAAIAVSGALSAGEHPMATGTVTKVDTQWNKVTIDHGPLENLDMPAMKMVFVVADPSMLEGLSEGTQILFTADRVNGKLTVTEIEVQ
ncbi:copper-binding protein [Ruegeria aquimaris]|uniref:Copper-binding protein n=1 Tax=Ruegeria aquimaris TaxID=2984333 RepID=A0ABT3AT38_9RHOB|nr:copper-binding protein [Ruegeria sp. XHP0148]MCV2891316.1 copper-binding protein [Ruegeria sp. XHP0148]